MRMRKKKNLEARLISCEKVLLPCDFEERNVKTAIEKADYYDLSAVFHNNNPVVMEIGCGQGMFCCEFAKTHPDLNIIAVEKVPNVIVTACEKGIENELSNLRFMMTGAEYLPRYIKPNSISEIYLNFSCPYPKNTYEKHRLTSKRFLDIYKNIMTPDAVICQKTDNMHFFEYSVESFSQNGFKLSNISLDLHHSDFEGNIMTEYETRFTDLGQPIYRLEARL